MLDVVTVYIVFVWVLNALALGIQDQCFFGPGNVAGHHRVSVANMPIEGLMGDMHRDRSMLGHTRRCAPPCPTESSQVSSRTLRA